jgi:hypothetical protein
MWTGFYFIFSFLFFSFSRSNDLLLPTHWVSFWLVGERGGGERNDTVSPLEKKVILH